MLWADHDRFGNIFIQNYRTSFQEQLERQCSEEEFYLAINHVTPSLVRVEADELTYNLHVMVRFEIELDVIEGRIQVEDLPEVWNAKMQEYLGDHPV